jgi:hypothetical protein
MEKQLALTYNEKVVDPKINAEVAGSKLNC